jgi:2-keto-4-pentenoate hydratase
MRNPVEALVESQRSGIPVDAATIAAPADVAAAMQTQADIVRALGAEVAGWKVGMMGEDGTAAPMYRHLVLPEAGRYARGGATFLGVEVEVGFHIARDIKSEADIPDALGVAFVGIEVVRSRLVEGGKCPFPLHLADNIANGAYVIGPERTDWQTLDLGALRCEVWRDGALVHDAVGGHPQKHPFAPMRANAANMIDKLGGFRAGQIITTGTLCGLVRIEQTAHIRARLEGFGEVSVEIVP